MQCVWECGNLCDGPPNPKAARAFARAGVQIDKIRFNLEKRPDPECHVVYDEFSRSSYRSAYLFDQAVKVSESRYRRYLTFSLHKLGRDV